MSLDVEILGALRKAGAGSISGAELSQALKVSRAAIWARIQELRDLGFDIEASPHHGYRLLSSPDLLLADDLLARLGAGLTIGRDIRVFQETTSTNDIVEKLARDGVKEGVAVFAESQTKGRGRLGRTWVSPNRKGLWFSLLLRPQLRPQEATRLTVCSAIALRRAIANLTGISPEIKWPNDILIHGKKTAGILTELQAELDQVRYLVLGMGVNVNQTASDFTPELAKVATSLRVESRHAIGRPELAVAILRELNSDYERLKAGRFSEIADEWESFCTTLGHQIVLRTGGREIRGRAEALNEDGSLLLRTEHGRLEPVIGGDVTLVK